MTRVTTNRDIQRLTFVESLHASLRKEAARVLEDHKKFNTLASSYLSDGLDESECVELLMIDGLSREAAESYTAMAVNTEEEIEEDALFEYSFQFEDNYAKIWSSYDIGKTIKASGDEEAWRKAEGLLNDEGTNVHKVLSVTRIS